MIAEPVPNDPPTVETFIAGCEMARLDRSDARIVPLLNRYRRLFLLHPGGIPNDGAQWHGIFFDNRLVCAFADRTVDGNAIIEHLCPERGRYGVLGMYAALMVYRALMKAGLVRSVSGTVLCDNGPGLALMAKVFGVANPKPRAQVFVYEGWT